MGNFYKLLMPNFGSKVAQIFGDFSIFFLKNISLLVNTAEDTFCQLLGNFYPTSGHAVDYNNTNNLRLLRRRR